MSRWDTEPKPDWIVALEEAVALSSQNAVARELGVSASMVSAVRKGTYKGHYTGIEQAVRAKLMDEEVDCPLLARIKARDCLRHQGDVRAARLSNRLQRQMHRACRACPRFTKEASNA